MPYSKCEESKGNLELDEIPKKRIMTVSYPQQEGKSELWKFEEVVKESGQRLKPQQQNKASPWSILCCIKISH